MRLIKLTLISFFLIQVSGCQSQETSEEEKAKQEAIIQEHVYDCADKINYRMRMKEYQDCLDAGLKKDSTIAYLWQQKAMPYYKAKKYSVGKPFLDKAVLYDEKRWLSYRGFMKCIFSKDYKGAIEDLQKCIEKYGNSYEMDHTYAFYIGLAQLQLNEFTNAEATFKSDIDHQIKERGEAHFLDWFYYGISLYKQQKWDDAIFCFDKTLNEYSNFSEAQLYKAEAMMSSGKNKEKAEQLLQEALANGKQGYTINEDNVVYENYPYQIIWNK